jgi:hypothetical protein
MIFAILLVSSIGCPSVDRQSPSLIDNSPPEATRSSHQLPLEMAEGHIVSWLQQVRETTTGNYDGGPGFAGAICLTHPAALLRLRRLGDCEAGQPAGGLAPAALRPAALPI